MFEVSSVSGGNPTAGKDKARNGSQADAACIFEFVSHFWANSVSCSLQK